MPNGSGTDQHRVIILLIHTWSSSTFPTRIKSNKIQIIYMFYVEGPKCYALTQLLRSTDLHLATVDLCYFHELLGEIRVPFAFSRS